MLFTSVDNIFMILLYFIFNILFLFYFETSWGTDILKSSWFKQYTLEYILEVYLVFI